MFIENLRKKFGNEGISKSLYWVARSLLKDFTVLWHGLKPISLGGWCGPTKAIREVSLDPKAYPFDHIRTTFEGICKFFKDDFKDFFPEKPLVSEKIWGHDAFRGRYASFWYHDITKPEVMEAFKRRIKRLIKLLETTRKTIVFIRVVTDEDPKKEFSQIDAFREIVSKKFPNLKYKLVFIVHGQDLGTVQTKPIDDNTAVWCVSRSRMDRPMDITDYALGYKEIINLVTKKNSWPPKSDVTLSDIKKANDLWLVDCIPMVKQ